MGIYDIILSDFKSLISKKDKKIPKKFLNEFTMNGKIKVIYKFRDDAYPKSKPIVFSKIDIEHLITEIKKGKLLSYYGKTDVYLSQAFKKYSSIIKNSAVLDIGSVTGRYSAFALAYGASESYVLEYNNLISEYKKIKILNYDTIKSFYNKFNVATSISSFEHDGLGRYGDSINPNGDIQAMKFIKHVIKKGGILFLVVPVGRDKLVWNLHRVYGKLRLPKLLVGWELIDSFGFNENDLDNENKHLYYGSHQPVFVLKRI